MKDFKDGDLSRLREAVAEQPPRSAPEGCPGSEELWESAAGELDPVENEAVILHLARCSECSLIWRLAREMLVADRDASSSVIPISRGGRWRTWRKVVVPAIAAAMLIGIGLGASWLIRRGASPEPVFRQQPDAGRILASPETQRRARSACRLEWSAGPEGTLYDLIATDERLNTLVTVRRLERPEYELAPEVIPTSATEVLWRITAHLPDGRTVVSDTFRTGIAGE